MNEPVKYKARSPMWTNPMATGLFTGRGKRGVVYMPSIFDNKKIYPFRPIQIRLLHAIAAGDHFEDICTKLELTTEEALDLLRKPKCKEYLSELESMEAGSLALNARERIIHEFRQVWMGEVKKDREQMEAGKELLARFAPRPERSVGSGGEGLQININIGKIEEAFKRQDAMEAQNIEEGK